MLRVNCVRVLVVHNNEVDIQVPCISLFILTEIVFVWNAFLDKLFHLVHQRVNLRYMIENHLMKNKL